MNLLNKLTIKNLKLNKKRTIVTIIGIMLSVALITAVASIYTSGIKSLINFETYQKGNFHVAYYNVPINEISTFKNNRNIEIISLTQNVGYAKIDSKNEYKPYAYIKSFTKNSLSNLSIKLVEGRFPENENEILIPTHLKTNGRLFLNIGDTITLNVGIRVDEDGYELKQNNPYQKYDYTEGKVDASTGEIIEEINGTKCNENIIKTQTKSYKIVGIIERPATNIEEYSAPGYTFITYTDENNLNENVDLYVRYTKNGLKNSYKTTANILGVNETLYEKVNKQQGYTNEEFQNYLKEMDNAKYETDINSYLIDLETNPIVNSSVGNLSVVVGIVIGIIVFTSIFCIKNSFDISITEKIKQYGMLKSIGATKKQVKKNVFYEATILGIIGIPLGILSGFLATYILIIISNYYLKDMLTAGLRLEFVFSYISVLVAIILGIITIYASALKSAKRASKTSPIDSIRNSANIKINPKKIRSPKLVKKAFGIGGVISYKNLKRNKKKYRTTVISIAVSVFVFIALSSFMSMAFNAVDNTIKVSEYNVSLMARDYGEQSYKKYIETTKLDNISDYVILRTTGLYFNDDKYSKEYKDWLDLKPSENYETYIMVVVLGHEQYNKYIKSLGLNYDDIKDKGILYDYNTVGKYDKEKNKYIYKTMRLFNFKNKDIIEGILDHGEKFSIEIGYIANTKPFGLKNIDNEYLIISDEIFDKFKTSKVLEIDYKSNNADKLQNDIDELLKGENYNLNNIDENVKMVNNLFTLVGIFLYGFIIVISLIGITNIFNTITTNMELRKQEFAMLKSIGMTHKEFNRMIRLESLFMGIKALLFGIPIGIVLSYMLYCSLSEGTGIPYKLPLLAILISILTVFILISLIMRYSMKKINKQNTIETIRNENI